MSETEATRLLLVEDDELVVHLIERFLEGQGFDVSAASNGIDGLARARSGDFEIVLLDIDLPGMSGIDVLRRLREDGNPIPVLMVSAIDDKANIARALDEGADDYVPKPVDPQELPARMRAVLRRHRQPASAGAEALPALDDLSFDETRRSITGPLGSEALTATEASLLRELVRTSGRPLGADELHERIWGLRVDPGTNVIAAHVSRLRQKIARSGSRVQLKATRGAGYELMP